MYYLIQGTCRLTCNFYFYVFDVKLNWMSFQENLYAASSKWINLELESNLNCYCLNNQN